MSNILTPKNEVAVGSNIASSGRDVVSVVAGSEREEQTGFVTLSVHASSRNKATLHFLNLTDESQRIQSC